MYLSDFTTTGFGSNAAFTIAIKDGFMQKGAECRAGSKVLSGMLSPYDAHVIEKLKNTGFTLSGRTCMDKFAMGSTSKTCSYGITESPKFPGCYAGGSSGGSAAAVASHSVRVALGSDTGGSVRKPAAWCGCIGFKPSYGAISRYGLIGYAPSLDHVGILSRTIEDCKTVFNVIRGKDERDSTSVDIVEPVRTFKKIGVFKGTSCEIVKSQFESYVSKLNYEYIDIESLKYAVSAYYILATAEASSELSRYDGKIYGQSREEFGFEVKKRIILGTAVLSSGHEGQFYQKAQIAREHIIREFDKIFREFDVIIMPTSPVLPHKIGEKQEPLSEYMADCFTIPANLAGIPAISIPYKDIGIQFMSAKYSDDSLLEFVSKISL